MDEAERQTHDMERDLPEGAEDERWSVDETSRRIANLLFLFTTTRRPVPTRDIVCDSDLGYGSGNVESDMRKFRRDRDALARRGCFIVQAGAHAAAENEESSWELDRKRTYASVPSLPADDLILLIRAIDIARRRSRSGPRSPRASAHGSSTATRRGSAGSARSSSTASSREGTPPTW